MINLKVKNQKYSLCYSFSVLIYQITHHKFHLIMSTFNFISNRFLKTCLLSFLLLLVPVLFAQQNASAPESEPVKIALVIGNGAYTGGLSRLANPVNDANDMTAVLESLGFTVDKILDGNQNQMETAVTRLKDRLSESPNSYGFFFYAGHGVQSGGENFLIPVDANIPGENYLRNRAVSVQTVLDDLNDARNSLNVVVLDACRDNPFGWSRSGTRGLAIISRQPADSIIVYATSAGQRAVDGEGRNGLFTGQLLQNLLIPGLEVKEVFNRTGADVADVSGRQQIPAVYNQFFGTAYLGAPPGSIEVVRARPAPIPFTPQPERDSSADMARLWTVGVSAGTAFSAPWFIGTLRGTVAPFRYSFLELGFDLGLVSGVDGLAYTSIYPFAHYALFVPFILPFGRKDTASAKSWRSGWYVGAGGGYMRVMLRNPDEDFVDNFFAASVTTGFNIGNMLNISYTLQTNFENVGNKVSVGWTYRFK